MVILILWTSHFGTPLYIIGAALRLPRLKHCLQQKSLQLIAVQCLEQGTQLEYITWTTKFSYPQWKTIYKESFPPKYHENTRSLQLTLCYPSPSGKYNAHCGCFWMPTAMGHTRRESSASVAVSQVPAVTVNLTNSPTTIRLYAPCMTQRRGANSSSLSLPSIPENPDKVIKEKTPTRTAHSVSLHIYTASEQAQFKAFVVKNYIVF